MNTILNSTIEKLSSLIKPVSPPATFIVGAGISIPSGLPKWNSFAAEIAKVIALDHPRATELLAATDKLRPEVMFQAIYRVMGDRTFELIRAMDPHLLRERGIKCQPNSLHFFLAKLINMGHIVVTTNFDDLIEEAAGRSCQVISTQSKIGEIIRDVRIKRFSGLIKLHGTFRTSDGKESTESIGAILQEVQRAMPHQTKELLDVLLTEGSLVVFGHSGRDDFDLYQRLSADADPFLQNTIWIKHVNEEETWHAATGSQIDTEEESIKVMPPDDKYFDMANPLKIVKARGGVLVKAHTRSFLQSVFPAIIDWTSGESTDTCAAIKGLVEDWANKLTPTDKQSLIISLLEAGGPAFFTCAREQMELLYPITNSEETKAMHDFSVGRILYKIGGKKAFDEALPLLRTSAAAFAQMGARAKEADSHLQLALVLNRLSITDEKTQEMMNEARKAVDLYASLANMDYKYIFDLGTALRAYALSVYRSVPDLDSLSKIKEKTKCKSLLEFAYKYAYASLSSVDFVGNYLGERGQGQCLNVIGLIEQKLGDYQNLKSAEQHFEAVIDLSQRSGKGFEKEEFQGFRNLGLVLRSIARISPPDQREGIFKKALDKFNKAEKLSSATDLFNVKFNIILLEVEAQFKDTDWNAVQNHLVDAEVIITKDQSGKPNWHWNAWFNATAAKVAFFVQKPDEVLRRVKTVNEIYEQVSPDQIQGQAYGVQNARNNVSNCIHVLNSIPHDLKLDDGINELSRRFAGLEQRIPDIIVSSQQGDPLALVEALFKLYRIE